MRYAAISAGSGLLAYYFGFTRLLDSLAQPPDTPTKIKQFISEIGTRSPTVEETKAYFPLIARLYVENSRTPLAAQEIVDSTFLIQRDYLNYDEAWNSRLRANSSKVFEDPVIVQLQKDYPNLSISQNLASSIVKTVSFPENEALTDFKEKKIFLIYDRDTRSYRKDGFVGRARDDYYSILQYQLISPVGNCLREAPIISLGSTYLHEIVHLDATQKRQPEDRYLDFIRKQYVFNDIGDRQEIWGFTLLDYKDNKIIFSAVALDELVVDYIQAKIFEKYGVPFIIEEDLSFDYSNLQKVLQQSGITFDELMRMHRESRLSDFLMKIAVSAKNIEGNSDLFEFAADRFLLWDPYVSPWLQIKPHFDNIDDQIYFYPKGSAFHSGSGNGLIGCLR